MITLDQVSKSFDGGNTFAVNKLSLQILPGELFVLLGSSGCGKSTTMKMINRLIEPTSGRIEVNGQNVLDQDPVNLKRSIGYVFQGIGLFPHMTIEENVGIVLKLLGFDKAKRYERSKELLDMVSLPLETYGKRFPKELSGGQQQRVGVARALAADPDILLMDEPFGALDALTRDDLQQEILHLKHTLNKTIVFVTHDLFEALALGDRIAIMHAGQLEQVGTKEEVLQNPATDFVKDLFEKPAKQLAAFQEIQQELQEGLGE
ncbi:MAG: betaine/proline/choline family ABC transporter ATP-binding protein [Vampirovibrio sp.]|nr:betaine/proline/choline family ABC transporter ATP-binding protein [Vampirovibrio sp.]